MWRRVSGRLVRIESIPVVPMAEPIQPMTLKDLCYPVGSIQPSCIRLPQPTANNFEIKPQIINMLPKFTGLEDAYIFIREFEEVCATMKLQLTEDEVKLRLINFALKDNAKKWLYSLPNYSVTTWEGFVRTFLKKYFPHHKTARIRNEINQFYQLAGESFWKYFDRFKNLLTQCPHHGIETWRLCQIIYEGLDSNSRTMLESMCQGQFMDKETTEAWQFLEDLAEKNLQWETTREPDKATPSRGGMHQIQPTLASEAKIATLTRRLEALELQRPANVNQISAPMCKGCNAPDHVLEECSYSNECAQVNATYQGPLNNPYAPTYNPGWRNHPNFSWSQNPNVGNPNFNQQNLRSNPVMNNPPGFHDNDKKITSLEKSLEAMMKTHTSFMQTTGQLINNNTQAIARLEMQVSQLASTISEREHGRLPSQHEPNPRNQNGPRPQQGNQVNGVNAIHTLRSGKQIDNKVVALDDIDDSSAESPSKTTTFQPQAPETENSPSPVLKSPRAPFPNRLKSNKSEHLDKILEVFKQVQVNIPLLDIIHQVPTYAKFLKDLCTRKRTTNVPKKAFLAASVSSYLSSHVPIKYKDPGAPTISCVIGETNIKKALLDLGASVNILPYSVYEQLGLEKLQPTGITLQLADRSLRIPKGMVEDVLIKVENFIFPVDFIIL